MQKSLEVLAILADGGFHSGASIARTLNVTRAAVWERVTTLRAAGLEVLARSGRGYALAHPVELLRADAILDALDPAAREHIRELQVLSKTDSTNQRLFDQSLREDIHGIACTAEMQTRGRGRRGDAWVAPLASGLYLSLGWRFERPPATFAALGLVVGVTTVAALARCGCGGIGLKWPNDLVADGRKLGGILIELRSELSGPTVVVIGIGINVALGEAIREKIDQPNTDLAQACKIVPSRNRLAAALLSHLAQDLSRFGEQGFAPWRRRFEQYDVLRGKQIELVLPDCSVRGIAEGVSDSGALNLRSDGRVRSFVSGRIGRID